MSTSQPPSPPSSTQWHWTSAFVGALVTAILMGGAFLLWGRPEPPPIVLHPPPTVTPLPLPTTTPTPAPLTVYVSGAVVAPGLYSLPAGARAGHALEAAGGLLPDADPAAVNQATLLWDGAQVHVPLQGETASVPPPGASTSPANGVDGAIRSGPVIPVAAPGLININTATAAELETLPGIGPARAEDIIANRPYASIEELERVPGIGPAILEQLRDLVTVQ
jgi:competence protein ComEA